MLRIATIANLAARPFGLVPPAFPADVMPCATTEVYSRTATGMCDAALLPAARLRDLQHVVEPLGGFGIASSGPAHSVLLRSAQPLDRVAVEGRPVYLSGRSQTSRDLFTCLCAAEYDREPAFTHVAEEAEAWLLTGDEAVRARLAGPPCAFEVDLGTWWRRQTGYPFVWARWVVRREVSAEDRLLLREWLEETVSFAESPEGVARLAEAGVAELPGPDAARFAARYYRDVRPRLTLADLHGLSEFLRVRGEQEPWVKTA